MYYNKPKPETILKNKENNQKLYSKEIKWCQDNLESISKDKFLMDMYGILITGKRKMTPKMIESVQRSMTSPKYDKVKQIEAQKKLQPIIDKIHIVERLAEEKNDKALEFVQSVREYVRDNYRITKKQMEGLNKVYKRVSEDLFKKEKTND